MKRYTYSQNYPGREQLLEIQAARGIVAHRGWAYGAVSRACLLLDRLDEAQRLGERSAQSTQRQTGFSAHALHLLGDIAAHPDHFDAETAATHYRGALGLAKMRGMLPLVAHCHFGLGKIYRRTGEAEYASENLVTARRMYGELDMRFWLEPEAIDLTNLSEPDPLVGTSSPNLGAHV